MLPRELVGVGRRFEGVLRVLQRAADSPIARLPNARGCASTGKPKTPREVSSTSAGSRGNPLRGTLDFGLNNGVHHNPPPAYKGRGRPRVKGRRRVKPPAAVGRTRKRRRLKVGWDGGGIRRGRSSPARATGTRRAGGWCRSAGCSCTTATALIARSTSSRPTRTWSRRRSSATTRRAGTLKPPFKNSAPTSDWRRHAAGAERRYSVRRRACSGCIRWWRRGTTSCRNRLVPGQ